MTEHTPKAHDHWRWPSDVPCDGQRCSHPNCRAVFNIPFVVSRVLAESDDARSKEDVFEDVRFYCEMLSLWFSVELHRRDRYDPDGISTQEAHVQLERLIRLYRARRIRHHTLAG